MSPTLTEVAKRANVALSTASRAFSDPDRLGPNTLRKNLSIAQELGYEPPVARSAEPSGDLETVTVAVVVPDIANPVFGAFVKSAQSQSWYRRHAVVLADSDFDPDREREVITHLRGQVDGIIVCSPRLDADEVLGLCGRVPVVLVNREAAGADCVIADASDGLRQTVDYLTALGHRRIAYVQGSGRSWSNAHRVAVAWELAAGQGLELEVLGWPSETVASGTVAAASVVASGASAVIAHNPELEAELTDADVLVSGRCTAATAAAGKRLVHAAGAGVDKIDVEALPPGTQVANTFHHEDSIAEYVVAVTILLRRRLLSQDAALRRGEWATPAHDPGSPWTEALAAATLGFVGFGHIGARTWERFRAFGAHGLAVTRRGDVDAAAHRLDWSGAIDDLGSLLDRADVVVVSAPITPETIGMIGPAEPARMPQDALLVNVGHGPIVDERALYEALGAGSIARAAIDVWYSYPAEGHTVQPSALPFHELPNVLMAPHSSGLTRQTFAGRAADIAANIRRLAAGQPLVNVVAVAP